ncbi:DUF2851 family protein [Paracnuella aquatica]|uniref:DUF2851 family protein n=1 Tax=Paracnuella aquatica TaxID=2268757 RepID=UPI000DEFA863|nr:DUF2851 family protein [Paracnuella aquatica]RPD51667.1 DUF2851 family protein [Paracnuella aquatica]
MTEKLLQFIWKFQYFNRAALRTTSNDPIDIIFPGQHNTEQGPDFLQARVRIGATKLAGSIELHLKTSDWDRHGHSGDANYNNVVLHVVYQHDGLPNPKIPVLELQPRIHSMLYQRYEALMQCADFIPCGNAIATVPPLTMQAWLDRLLAERLQRKATQLLTLRDQNNGSWEEAFWQMLARSFGAATNADAFEAIARSVPVKLLGKHKSSIHQLEAMLLGSANLLGPKWQDDYAQLLWREYQFLKVKYNLQPINMPVHFLRMRPPNFPTIRLAQLAALLHRSSHLFSRIIEAKAVADIQDMLHATANDYWHYHYRFDEQTGYLPKKIGQDMLHHLMINVVAPALFAFGLHHKQDHYTSRAVELLATLPPEKNAIISGFAKLGVKTEHAAASQALIELKNNYCNNRRCLECAVGNAILRRDSEPQRSGLSFI